MGTRLFLKTFLTVICLVNFNWGCEYNAQGDKDQNWQHDRQNMVKVLHLYGIKDPQVLKAMGKIKRHLFIPQPYRSQYNPYGNHACPIGFKQTISQPYIVAYMTEKLALRKGEKVLEIGSGSGYQAAVLAELGIRVYSVEILKELADHARSVLKSQGYDSVKILNGDGYKGWPQYAPYDAIIVTCAPENIPEKLVQQLKEEGRMIIPVGKFYQRLVILRKKKGQVVKEYDLDVRFVPMVHPKKK